MLFDGYSSKMSVGINIILKYNLNQNPYGKDEDFIRPTNTIITGFLL